MINTIVVVGRRDSALESIAFVTREQGYEVLAVASEAQAESVADRTHIALIVLVTDVRDPDSLAICQRLHAKTTLVDTPIVVIGSAGMSTDRKEWLQAGAVDYLITPIQPHEFIQCLKRALG